MRTVHKQSIASSEPVAPDTFEVFFPRDARILYIGTQYGGAPTIWYECDSDTDPKATSRRYRVVGTGARIEQRPHEHLDYKATCVGDMFVWHVYEVTTT